MSYFQFLSKVRLGDCPKFSISGYFIVKVVKVYDGDTITVTFDPNKALFNNKISKSKNFRAYEHQVRMMGYNSEEIRQPIKEPKREELKKQAIKARDVLRKLILRKLVLLEVSPSDDKYGRLLGRVFLIPPNMTKKIYKNKKSIGCIKKFRCVNTYMVSHKYGKPYFGGTKK